MNTVSLVAVPSGDVLAEIPLRRGERWVQASARPLRGGAARGATHGGIAGSSEEAGALQRVRWTLHEEGFVVVCKLPEMAEPGIEGHLGDAACGNGVRKQLPMHLGKAQHLDVGHRSKANDFPKTVFQRALLHVRMPTQV